MMPYMYSAYTGLGQTAQQGVQVGGTAASGAISAGVATGAISASTAAIAIPVIGGVVAAAGIILAWMSRRNAQKVAATHVVDEAEPFLRKNRDAFLASVAASTATEQERQQALANFDNIWSQVVRECQAIGGGGGERCISDRVAGACMWRDAGECWNWFVGYRDPIANATISAYSVSGPGDILSQVFGGGDKGIMSDMSLAVIGAGLIAAAVAL